MYPPRKGIACALIGVLKEVIKTEKYVMLVLEGQEAIFRCFLNSQNDCSHLLNKKVSCVGLASRRPIEKGGETVGFDTVFNVYHVKEETDDKNIEDKKE